MEKLLKKDVRFHFIEYFQKSLDVLKEKMVTVPILVFPEWKKEFHVHVDAYCIELGVVLAQQGPVEIDHPIEFASRELSNTEKNYRKMEREGLSMVYALQNFKHYLLGAHSKLFTHHSTLKYLVNTPILGGEIY